MNDYNQNVELNKNIVKEDEIVIDTNQKNVFAKKIINFLSSVLTLLIIGLGIYFLMDKNVLPNPFKVGNEPVVLEKEQITTEAVQGQENINTNLLTYEYPSPCSDGPQSIIIDKGTNTFLFTIYASTCAKTQLEGSAIFSGNKYTFLATNGDQIIGELNNEVLSVTYNLNNYELSLKK